MAGNSIVIQLFANTKWSPSMKKSSISKKKKQRQRAYIKGNQIRISNVNGKLITSPMWLCLI